MSFRIFFRRSLAFIVTVLFLSAANAAEQTLFLHSSGGQLVLNPSTPAAGLPQAVSSGPVGRAQFVEIGTWSSAPAQVAFELVSAANLQLWLGRRSSNTTY